MADEAELSVDRLCLSFGGLTVLDQISFVVAPGELLALVGPNGAGKTSILNCISGIYRPSGGNIRFAGRDITGLKPHINARAGLARTFQHGETFPHLTVTENLLVGRHRHGASGILADGLFLPAVRRREARQCEAVESVLDFTELARFRHHLVGGLPFGVQKLVGFARALALEPKALLLDEPSAGLNRDAREDLARFILRIKHELHIPLLWVEHDMQMVADLADRLYVVDYGRHVADGPPAAVLADPRVIEAYLGRGREGEVAESTVRTRAK